jgi:2-polyprenyl-3-methyl-5-hydroxy-6-metoxy-1,4-benzoquinol methylase
MIATGYQYPFYTREEMLNFVPAESKKILDVGCGIGTFGSLLKQRSDVEVWGVEIHPEAALVAEKHLDKVLCGDINNLLQNSLLEKSFDCIVFNDILEHLYNPDEILVKTKKILKSGGIVVSSIPNFRYVGNLWEIIVNKDFQYKNAGILDRTHVRFFTQKSILRLYEKAGYVVLTCEGINPTRSLKVKLFNILMLNHFSDIFYSQFATVAQTK